MKINYLMLLTLVLIVILAACKTNGTDERIMFEEDDLANKLSIELIEHNSDSLLYQKIMHFAENHPKLEVHIRHSVRGIHHASAWILGGQGSGDPPDILELTPTQMKLFFHHGKIEALGIQEPEFQDNLIHSHDGYVLGVKTKINPLIIYYNREIFRKHGLETPNNEWDWAQFEQTIMTLKEKGENVYIPVTPNLLEWVTLNRFGGRISDSSGMVFSGYLNSEEAAQAAEWLFRYNTSIEDFILRLMGGTQTYYPMPYDLIEDNIALAVDYPFYLQDTGIRSYVQIMERNEQIGITQLPGRDGMMNVALMSGIAIHKDSANKEAAMSLLRYLLEESDNFYRDTVVQSHQWGTGVLPDEGSNDWSVIFQEAKRTVPASLVLNEGFQWTNHASRSRLSNIHGLKDGQPVQDLLGRYAEQFDLQFEEFKKDLNSFYTCLKQGTGVCQQ